jgi:hypothetical protein
MQTYHLLSSFLVKVYIRVVRKTFDSPRQRRREGVAFRVPDGSSLSDPCAERGTLFERRLRRMRSPVLQAIRADHTPHRRVNEAASVRRQRLRDFHRACGIRTRPTSRWLLGLASNCNKKTVFAAELNYLTSVRRCSFAVTVNISSYDERPELPEDRRCLAASKSPRLCCNDE